MSFNHVENNHGRNILEKKLEHEENEPDQETFEEIADSFTYTKDIFGAKFHYLCRGSEFERGPNLTQYTTYKAMQGTSKWNSRTKKQLLKEHFHGYQETSV